MSGASSGDDSELESEVPTEVPSDFEEGTAAGMGCRALRGRLPPHLPLLWVGTRCDSLHPYGRARGQRLALDKAYRYLLNQGFSVLELASLDLNDSMQLADELAIPMGD